ncbi:hypothetical protein [Metabacillus iocasae]|uniref:Preprotein translocase subunit Sec63 n=1 Tax=Priestia iocasae TaxID=2291674 RepID=A0ABS2QY90_9BACI|nr:hypothetical protein [Metabacillus iocasae]MBM7704163.1 preprotein translocase subunit Sec63 [Metabacillus iocasae]
MAANWVAEAMMMSLMILPSLDAWFNRNRAAFFFIVIITLLFGLLLKEPIYKWSKELKRIAKES